MNRWLCCALALAVSLLFSPAALHADESKPAAPQVFLDKSPAVVKYQLKRLTNEQLVTLERKDTDPRYKPVYEALLTRKGLPRELRSEAINALVKLNSSDPVTQTLNGIEWVDPSDLATAGDLVSLLTIQKTQDLTARQDRLVESSGNAKNPMTRRAAYAALALVHGKAEPAWQTAAQHEGGTKLLLGSIPLIPNPPVRPDFYPRVEPLAKTAADEATRVAAIEALGYIPGHEAQAFGILSDLITQGQAEPRAAAIRSIRRLPASKWPRERVEPLAKTVVKLVEQTPSDQRANPQSIEAIQLGNDLASALPPAQAAPIRKALRELGVRIVLIKTLREQMLYDLRYFVAEAGKPVQIVLNNEDVMPHNLVITAPGSLQEIGLAAASLPPPADPAAKAYVPDNPKVLHATHLIQTGETATLSFQAPAQPGEYLYVCTFPGHFLRMYGVMLVVSDIEKWEAVPKAPTDPLLGQPFASQVNEPMQTPHEHPH